MSRLQEKYLWDFSFYSESDNSNDDGGLLFLDSLMMLSRYFKKCTDKEQILLIKETMDMTSSLKESEFTGLIFQHHISVASTRSLSFDSESNNSNNDEGLSAVYS